MTMESYEIGDLTTDTDGALWFAIPSLAGTEGLNFVIDGPGLHVEFPAETTPTITPFVPGQTYVLTIEVLVFETLLGGPTTVTLVAGDSGDGFTGYFVPDGSDPFGSVTPSAIAVAVPDVGQTPVAVFAVAPWASNTALPTHASVVPSPGFDAFAGGALSPMWLYFKTPDGIEVLRLMDAPAETVTRDLGPDGAMYSVVATTDGGVSTVRVLRSVLSPYGTAPEPATTHISYSADMALPLASADLHWTADGDIVLSAWYQGAYTSESEVLVVATLESTMFHTFTYSSEVSYFGAGEHRAWTDEGLVYQRIGEPY